LPDLNRLRKLQFSLWAITSCSTLLLMHLQTVPAYSI
jgi:hypothetical protein